MATSLSKYKNPALLEQYAFETGGRCELWQHLPREDRVEIQRMRKTNIRKPPEIHHIWHRSRHAFDYRSNIVIAGYVPHQIWGHNKYPVKLTIVSMYAKWFKDDPAEFSLDELREAAGQCPIAWLGRKRDEFEEGSDWWNMCFEMIEFV